MLYIYQTKVTKNQNNLLITCVLLLSLLLCGALIFVGYTKFLGIETRTGGDYPAFPNQLTQISIGSFDFKFNLIQIFIGAIYVFIHLLYILWILQFQRNSPYPVIKFLDFLKPAFPFLLLAFISYPLGNDIYLYLHYGLMGLNDINPFLHRAGSFSSELYEFLRWRQTSTYGPVSLIFFILCAIFVPISKVLAIYLFKLICLAAHLFNSYLVFRLLKKSPYLEKVILAYICNPLILFEQVGSGHVDVFVCTTFLFLIYCFKYKYYLGGVLTVWIGFMAKTLPILWLPLVAALLIQQRRWYSLVVAVIVSVAIVIFLNVTVLPTQEAWMSLLNPGVSNTLGPLYDTIGSFHRILATYLDYWPNLTPELKLDIITKFKLSTYVIFGAYYLVTLIQITLGRRYSEDDLGLDIGWLNWLLFVLATPWLMPWYTSILLPATALNFEERRFVIASLAFCLSSTAYYALIGTGVFQSWFVVGFPILVLGLELIISKSKKYVT